VTAESTVFEGTTWWYKKQPIEFKGQNSFFQNLLWEKHKNICNSSLPPVSKSKLGLPEHQKKC
jgi:hypothetical protein